MYCPCGADFITSWNEEYGTGNNNNQILNSVGEGVLERIVSGGQNNDQKEIASNSDFDELDSDNKDKKWKCVQAGCLIFFVNITLDGEMERGVIMMDCVALNAFNCLG